MAPKKPDEAERARTPIRRSAAGIRKQKPVPGPKLSTNAEDKTSSDVQNTITLLNQKQSPFLRLPAELRNQIYEYYFEEGSVYLDDSEIYYADSSSFRAFNYIGLILVCRQIHADTALFPYTKLLFNFAWFTSGQIGAWIEKRSQIQKEAIKKLYVDYMAIGDLDDTEQGVCRLKELVALKHVFLYSGWPQMSPDEVEMWKSDNIQYFRQLFQVPHLQIIACTNGDLGEWNVYEFRLDFDVKPTSP